MGRSARANRRQVRSRGLLLALLPLAGMLLPVSAAAAASRSIYTYAVTTSGTGTGDDFQSNGPPWLQFSGSLSDAWSITYDMQISVYPGQRSISLRPASAFSTTMWATLISGSASFEITTSCVPGSTCVGNPNTCSYSDVPLNRSTMTAIWESDAGPDYGNGETAYQAGKVRVDTLTGWIRGATVGTCAGGSGGTLITPSAFGPANDDLVGISWTYCLNFFDIPIDQLGHQVIVAPSEGDPTGCRTGLWGVSYTAHVHRTTTMRLLSGPVQITTASIDFADRAQRRATMLRSQVAALAGQKAKLEQEIIAEQGVATTAATGGAQLQPKLDQVQAGINATLVALSKLGSAEDGSSAEVAGLLEAEDRYANQVAALEQQVLAVERQGGDAAGLQKQLALAQRQLSSVESVLASRLAHSQIGTLRSQWLARLRALQNSAFVLQDAGAKLLAQQGTADATLTADSDTLRGVDIQLFQLAERLASFDPEVHEVDSVVDNQTVFTAKASYSYADLSAVNAAIAQQDQLINKIALAKVGAFGAFKVAEQDAIASQKQLAELLYKLAYGRFALDLAFDTYDIVRATTKGGVVGAVTALGTKLIEKSIKQSAGSFGSGIEPGSIAAQVNAQFDAGLKDAYSQPQIATVVAERILKDTVSKATKDGINKYVGSLVFAKVEFPVRLYLGDSPVTPGELQSQLENFTLKINRVSRLQDQLKSLEKGYLANFASKASLRSFFASEAENVAKDALKTIIKGQLDASEQQAWTDFFVKDAFARSFYSIYWTDADLWEKAMTQMDKLLASKAQLLQGSAEGELKTTLSEQFLDTEQITISLALSGYIDPNDPVAVFVNGEQARRTGSLYTIAGSSLRPGPGQTLRIVLR